jgi:PPM family protein phosphatase
MAEMRKSFGFSLSIAITSDVGRVRTNNEDSYGTAWLEDSSLFMVVCDGMGGHEAGEVASGLAVQVVEDFVAEDVGVDPRDRIYNALLEANNAILEEGRRSGTRGMGTTGVVSVLQGNQAYVGLVGDSRLYHVRKGQVLWRTLDHTRVQMLVDQGEITEDEARNHPESGMLTRALGHQRMADGRALEPEVLAEPLELQELDALVMSSDGLHDLLDDWEIAQMVAGKEPEEAAILLVETACERGGHDNVTVAVVTAGRRCGDYDPDYVPETYDLYEEDTDVEATYDGYQYQEELDEPPTPAPAPEVPASKNTMIFVGIGVVVVVLVVALIALFAAGLVVFSMS